MVTQIGNCRVLAEIGSGGMATVYKAVQEPLGRPVAVKMLRPNVTTDELVLKRFEREALFMASLQHENVIHVHDFVRDHGTLSIIMDYVEGIDLFDLLDRVVRLPSDVAAIVALQVARALDYAHFRGIVHRDIKPANIMLSYRGEVKLTDFGIARDGTKVDLTELGTGVGTPSYMSPEQVVGDRVDFRSDIFSLGIVLYQMVTGRKPFVEDSIQTVMQKIRLDQPTKPRKLEPSVPNSLERVIFHCLKKDPDHRYPSTQALIDDLTDFLSSRVEMNYNARLVRYMRDAGFITNDQAAHVLGEDNKATPPRKAMTWGAWSRAALVQFVLLLGAGGVAFSLQRGRDTIEQTSQTQTKAGALSLDQYARVYVRAHPWAHIFVDGKQVTTTPTADPLVLSDGVYSIRADNPYFPSQAKTIKLRKGQIVHVDFQLDGAGTQDHVAH